MRKLWQVFKWLSPFVVVALGVIQIVERVMAPRPKLRAEVEYARLVLPPPIEEDSKGIDSDIEVVSTRFRNFLIDYQFKSMWSISVANDGKKICTAVSLRLPDPALVRVEKDGIDPEFYERTKTVPLGDILPRDRVSVIVWSPSLPSIYTARQIRLTHQEGLGVIVVKAPGVSASSFWQWMEGNWFFGLLCLFTVVFLFLSYPSNRNASRRK